jgi:DNA polymerase III alpha subunit
MDSFGLSRRDLIWELGKLHLEDELALEVEDRVELPELTRIGKLNMEYAALGLSTEDHIMAILREWLQSRKIANSQTIETVLAGSHISCAGMVVVRQAPPTAKGFRFITLEDEFGFINVIVRPKIYDIYRRVLRTEQLLLVRGEVQRERAVVNLLAEHISPLAIS